MLANQAGALPDHLMVNSSVIPAGRLLLHTRSDLGAPALDRTRAHWRSPWKPVGCWPDKSKQHMVRLVFWNFGEYCVISHRHFICCLDFESEHPFLIVFDCSRSLGVTLWELFELGEQPYRPYSDRQVLTYAVREQQLKLPKPQVQFPLAERWWDIL